VLKTGVLIKWGSLIINGVKDIGHAPNICALTVVTNKHYKSYVMSSDIMQKLEKKIKSCNKSPVFKDPGQNAKVHL